MTKALLISIDGKQAIDIPLAGNAFIIPNSTQAAITRNGLTGWKSNFDTASTYFRVEQAGQLLLSIRAQAGIFGDSTIKITLNGNSKTVTLDTSTYKDYNVGSFNISTPGYIRVDIQGVTRDGDTFGEISHIIVSGEAVSGKTIFCDDPAYYFWSRRGPSCHLSYVIPTLEDVNYYYNEVTIPIGEDKIGSYFMVNGFMEGYFGIQVNSERERRVLFSVWSPFDTDNSEETPEDQKVTLNKIGLHNVTTEEFEGEGTGGKSYMKYNWSAGITYKLLLQGEPDKRGSTDYTAWFSAPEDEEWKLIASWKRPKTNTYLKGFHSFVENLFPDYGYLYRKAEFNHQWVRTASGKWLPISSAKFGVDSTYKAQQRIDATGGTIGQSFFLANGGFFNTIETPGTSFSVPIPAQDTRPKFLPSLDTSPGRMFRSCYILKSKKPNLTVRKPHGRCVIL